MGDVGWVIGLGVVLLYTLGQGGGGELRLQAQSGADGDVKDVHGLIRNSAGGFVENGVVEFDDLFILDGYAAEQLLLGCGAHQAEAVVEVLDGGGESGDELVQLLFDHGALIIFQEAR